MFTVIALVAAVWFLTSVDLESVCNLNRESLTVVERYFLQYALQQQNILSNKESVDKVLALVPEDILFTICCIIITWKHTVEFNFNGKNII